MLISDQRLYQARLQNTVFCGFKIPMNIDIQEREAFLFDSKMISVPKQRQKKIFTPKAMVAFNLGMVKCYCKQHFQQTPLN
jgi:hypothetical protein